VPIVSLQAVWPGGLRYEDARSNGISNLLAAVLPRGARGRGGDGLGTEPAGTAGELAGVAGRNSLGLRAEGPSAQWEGALERLADCIRNPRLADEDLERERRITLDDIRAQKGDGDGAGDLGHAAFRLFQSTLWKKHPYRLEVLGTAESLAALTRRKLVEHYRRYYPISALTIAVVGDVDAERVFAKVQTLLGDVAFAAPPGAPPPPVVAEPVRAEPAEVFQLLPREQAHVVLGYPGTTLQDADRFPLEVLSQILSGQGGRLPVELREKRPLAYQVSASSVQGIDPGYFAVYLACSPANLDQGVLAVRAELARVAADGVTADEVARARNHLAGAHALALQRRSALAGAIALGEAYGQGASAYRRYGDDIQKVTADDVKRVARKYLDSRREVVAVVRPQDPASPAARAGTGAERKPGAAGAPIAKGPGTGLGRTP
jgi:zinc protease